MDWSLLGCAAGRHVTYAPDEPALRARLSTWTSGGQAWRCLRCGTFVTGEPPAGGPAAAAPTVRRGKELRSAFILRVFAVERFVRAIVFAILSYALWRFKYSQESLEDSFQRELPVIRELLRQLGYNVSHSRLLGVIQHAFAVTPATLTWLALGAAGYAVIELIEGAGLWLLKRWGEYFAMIATSAGIPYEIYDLTAKVTVLRLLAFAINLALVAYLVWSKRLFGVRGGKRAYDARLRSESILGAEADTVAAARAAAAPPAAGAGESRQQPGAPSRPER